MSMTSALICLIFYALIGVMIGVPTYLQYAKLRAEREANALKLAAYRKLLEDVKRDASK